MKHMLFIITLVYSVPLLSQEQKKDSTVLTGKVKGLSDTTVKNGVLTDTRIRLSCRRSIDPNNNKPMLVVDGKTVLLNILTSINPNSVKNIVILKSAEATALYGPDGVNGAIIITTKCAVVENLPAV